VRTTQSNCCSAIDVLSSEPCPQQSLWLNALITKLMEFCSSTSMIVSQKGWRNQADGNALIQQCTNTALVQQLLRFPVLSGSAEAQVIWCGIVKCLSIAYFIGNISAKKVSKSVQMCQSYSKPKVGRFWDTVYYKFTAQSFGERIWKSDITWWNYLRDHLPDVATLVWTGIKSMVTCFCGTQCSNKNQLYKRMLIKCKF